MSYFNDFLYQAFTDYIEILARDFDWEKVDAVYAEAQDLGFGIYLPGTDEILTEEELTDYYKWMERNGNYDDYED